MAVVASSIDLCKPEVDDVYPVFIWMHTDHEIVGFDVSMSLETVSSIEQNRTVDVHDLLTMQPLQSRDHLLTQTEDSAVLELTPVISPERLQARAEERHDQCTIHDLPRILLCRFLLVVRDLSANGSAKFRDASAPQHPRNSEHLPLEFHNFVDA
jgi:hypothetical protein